MRSSAVEGAPASSKFFRRQRSDESEAPSTTLRVVPLPRYRGGGKTKHSRSRGAIFVRARVFRPPFCLTPSPCAVPGCRFAHPGYIEKRGSGTPRDASSNPRSQRGARSAERARLSASHSGSGQGDSWSPRPGTRPCFRGAVRSVQSCTAASIGRRRPCASQCMIRKSGCRFSGKIMQSLAGVTRAGKTNLLSPYSEHLACRSLCREDDARCRPGAGYKSARGHRARPVPRSVLAKNVPSKGEMRSFSSAGGVDSRNSAAALHRLDVSSVFEAHCGARIAAATRHAANHRGVWP